MSSNLQGARLICFLAFVESCLSFGTFIDKYKAQKSIAVSYEQENSVSRLQCRLQLEEMLPDDEDTICFYVPQKEAIESKMDVFKNRLDIYQPGMRLE